MAPDNNTTGTYGMEGAAASISNEYLVLKPILGSKNWALIEKMTDPNAFLRRWLSTAGPFIGLVEGSINEVVYVGDPVNHTFKAKTGAGVGAVR